MARMHTRRRGRSGSTRPPSTKTPQWLDLTPETVEQIAIELAREGTKPSEIGVILRDRHGVPSFRQVTGKRLVEFLSEAETAPEMPEDLLNLLDKAHSLVEHLRRNPSDGKNRHSLEGIEAKLHRLSKYYKRVGRLPSDWRYKNFIAQLE